MENSQFLHTRHEPRITAHYENQNYIKGSFTDVFKHQKLSYRIDFHSFVQSSFELISKFFDKIQQPDLAEIYRDKAKKREYRIDHLEKKLIKDQDKKNFGKDLLVHTRNMPQLNVLINYQLEKKASREWLKNFKNYKTDKPFDEDTIEKFIKLKEQLDPTEKNHGICYSIVLHFIRDYLNDPQSDIIDLAEKYKRGGDASVTAFQSIYEAYEFIDNAKRSIIMYEVMGLQRKPPEQVFDALKMRNFLKEKNWTRENINAAKKEFI